MALSSKQKQYCRQNAESFIYIFLFQEDLPYFSQEVRSKWAGQIELLSQEFGKDYNHVEALIADTLKEKYGKDPRYILQDLYNGKRVMAKGVAGIGAPSEVDDSPIDPATGFSLNSVAGIGELAANTSNYSLSNPYKPVTIGNESSLMDSSTGKPIGVVNTATGATVSVYNEETGEFEKGVMSDTKNAGNFWVRTAENMNWVSKILETIINIIRTVFGITKSNVSDVSSNQSDGWFSVSDTSAGKTAGNLLLLGGILLGVAMLDDGKKGKKKRR